MVNLLWLATCLVIMFEAFCEFLSSCFKCTYMYSGKMLTLAKLLNGFTNLLLCRSSFSQLITIYRVDLSWKWTTPLSVLWCSYLFLYVPFYYVPLPTLLLYLSLSFSVCIILANYTQTNILEAAGSFIECLSAFQPHQCLCKGDTAKMPLTSDHWEY